MEARRRTLASEGPAGNSAHPYSSIPIPTSAMKKTGPLRGVGAGGGAGGGGASRMSLAPSSQASMMGQSRVSTAGFNVGGGGASGGGAPGSQGVSGGLGVSHSGSDGPGAGARRSTIMSSRNGGGEGLLMSGNRGDGGIYGRTPQTGRSVPSSARRSSVYTSAGAGRPSLAPGTFTASSTLTKDTRPIRDKTFQSTCQRNITEFLLHHRYPFQIGPKTLVSPTQREFQSIFRFLISELIDPSYPWGKKFEDDCILVMKDLRYPAMEMLGKTALVAPGTQHTWPGLLAMLNWLVELCRAHDTWDDPELVSDPLLMPVNELPIDHPGLEDRLLWDFSSKTYREWFDQFVETFPVAEQELAEIFDRLAASSLEECEQLEIEINKKEVELRQLQAQEPPLKKLEEEYLQLMSDKTKFIAFIDLHKQKADKLKQVIVKARAAIAEHAAQIDAARIELQNTEAAVSAQNLSPDEVNRMNHERETLTRNLDELRIKVNEASQLAYDQEMQVTKSMDRFEQLIQDYTALGHQIGTIVPLHENMGMGGTDSIPVPGLGPGGIDYTIDIDLGAEDLNEIQAAGRKAMSLIRPALQSFGEGLRKQVRELQDSTIALEDENDQLGQKVERQKEEVANLEMRLKVVHEQAEEAKNQLQAETAETNRTVAKLETEVTAMSTASQQGVLTVQSQLESTKIEFKELRHKMALLQDSIMTQLMSHIDTIIKAKEHTANSLKGVRTFAEAQ